jgi:antitoxin ParD1/3/4
MPTLNLSLTPELQQIIQAKVDSGGYHDASEVVCDAILQMDLHQKLINELKLARLQSALADGIEQAEQGQSRPYTLEDLRRDLKARP